MCQCFFYLQTNSIDQLKKRYHFYDKSNDRLGSEWDSFTKVAFLDDKGNKVWIYHHEHLGFINSWGHYLDPRFENLRAGIGCEGLVDTMCPKGWKCLEDEKTDLRFKSEFQNNSVLPELIKFLKNSDYGERKKNDLVICPELWKTNKKRCEKKDCKLNHKRKEFLCPWGSSCKFREKCWYAHNTDDDDDF